MQNKKYISMLGLARRAGRLSMGHDTVLESVRGKKSLLVIFASDISPRLVREITGARDNCSQNTPCVQIDETIDELHMALGYRAGVISVNDENFAKRILELINQEGNEYGHKS